jgi:hypothetical protein
MADAHPLPPLTMHLGPSLYGYIDPDTGHVMLERVSQPQSDDVTAHYDAEWDVYEFCFEDVIGKQLGIHTFHLSLPATPENDADVQAIVDALCRITARLRQEGPSKTP